MRNNVSTVKTILFLDPLAQFFDENVVHLVDYEFVVWVAFEERAISAIASFFLVLCLMNDKDRMTQ